MAIIGQLARIQRLKEQEKRAKALRMTHPYTQHVTKGHGAHNSISHFKSEKQRNEVIEKLMK